MPICFILLAALWMSRVRTEAIQLSRLGFKNLLFQQDELVLNNSNNCRGEGRGGERRGGQGGCVRQSNNKWVICIWVRQKQAGGGVKLRLVVLCEAHWSIRATWQLSGQVYNGLVMAGGAAIQCSCTKEHRKCSVARREAEHDDRGQQRTDEDLKNF